MRFGIITLVSDNYGNKYQNYAVEQLLSEYGNVETFRLENLFHIPAAAETTMLQKLNPRYFREVLIARPMYQYDINRIDRGILYNLILAKSRGGELLALKQERSKRIEAFSEENLHISQQLLDRENTSEEWASRYDFFICGSDQIWNPRYGTTSELAFCSFAPQKTICLSPSFGVSTIPEYRRKDYSEWLKQIYSLSVREEAGQTIIRELTGRDAPVLLDPTMTIQAKKWEQLCKKPKIDLPNKYIVCYFLGRVDKTYKRIIDAFSVQTGLSVVMLFDITTSQYYSFDPAEVLYAIKHAEYILTDSFHGSVFSILFHKNFSTFVRNEGKNSMNSRLETLLKKFSLEDRMGKNIAADISAERWKNIDFVLKREREKTLEYLSQAIRNKY